MQVAQETLSLIRVVRAYGTEVEEFGRYSLFSYYHFQMKICILIQWFYASSICYFWWMHCVSHPMLYVYMNHKAKKIKKGG